MPVTRLIRRVFREGRIDRSQPRCAVSIQCRQAKVKRSHHGPPDVAVIERARRNGQPARQRVVVEAGAVSGPSEDTDFEQGSRLKPCVGFPEKGDTA
jgi:hypothetical protein